jgi:hypothetical protein
MAFDSTAGARSGDGGFFCVTGGVFDGGGRKRKRTEPIKLRIRIFLTKDMAILSFIVFPGGPEDLPVKRRSALRWDPPDALEASIAMRAKDRGQDRFFRHSRRPQAEEMAHPAQGFVGCRAEPIRSGEPAQSLWAGRGSASGG